MATKPAAKPAAKKAMPVRGQRTATNRANATPSMHDWQVKEDVHHLRRAAEIQSDPKRHKAAVAEAQAQMKDLAKVVKK